jgi:3-phosphoglycerate kinase
MLKKATLGLLSKHLNPASQVVVRADFNVPIKEGKVGDVNRIKSTFTLS